MAIDRAKLSSLKSRGIFNNGPEYQEWNTWRSKLLDTFEVDRSKHSSASSSVIPIEYLDDTFKLCEGRYEDAINVFVSDMVENGASWEHLTVLCILAGDDYRSIVPAEHAGVYKAQIADWLLWTSPI